jgi:hypothetical protein
MGLDKAPRPDDFTVRFLIREWNIFGFEVVKGIQEVFRSSQALESWMLSYLVLVPKIEHPSKPAHFRPLSVCSIYYRNHC